LNGHQGVTADSYNALMERCIDIGETSLDDDVPAALEGIEPPLVPSASAIASPAGYTSMAIPAPIENPKTDDNSKTD
jgi:hypothetical protein